MRVLLILLVVGAAYFAVWHTTMSVYRYTDPKTGETVEMYATPNLLAYYVSLPGYFVEHMARSVVGCRRRIMVPNVDRVFTTALGAQEL